MNKLVTEAIEIFNDKDLRNPILFLIGQLILILCLLFLIFSSTAHAQTFTVTETGNELTVTYIEPTTNDNAALTPLDDLDHTTIYWDILGMLYSRDVPATSLNGGGTILETIIVTKVPGIEIDVPVFATAWDDSGNESRKSNTEIKPFDWLLPSPIQ